MHVAVWANDVLFLVLLVALARTTMAMLTNCWTFGEMESLWGPETAREMIKYKFFKPIMKEGKWFWRPEDVDLPLTSFDFESVRKWKLGDDLNERQPKKVKALWV